MALVEQCTGLRVSELLALRWAVVDFERLSMAIKEGVVHGQVSPTKTECSEADFPLDPDFATVLLEWNRLSNGSELMFPSHKTGRCYHASPIQQDWIRRAGWCLVECP
jgi:integrase